MNAGFDDDEFTAVDVESRGSEPKKQSNDPPPEFTGTKPSEFKSYRKKVKFWLLSTRTPAQLQGPRVLSRLTGPAWDACDGLEPEDVATADGVKVILDTLAEAFQGEHETELFDALEDTFCGPGRQKREIPCTSGTKQRTGAGQARSTVAKPSTGVSFVTPSKPEYSGSHRHHDIGNSLSFSDVRKAYKRYADEFLRDAKEHDTRGPHRVCVSQARATIVGSEEQEGNSDVETALAALAGKSDIDLEETDVQEILLAEKESRQLRGEQRVNHGYRPVTGHTSGRKPYRVEGRLNIKELISRTRCRTCREKGHWARECPNKGKTNAQGQ